MGVGGGNNCAIEDYLFRVFPALDLAAPRRKPSHEGRAALMKICLMACA